MDGVSFLYLSDWIIKEEFAVKVVLVIVSERLVVF